MLKLGTNRMVAKYRHILRVSLSVILHCKVYRMAHRLQVEDSRPHLGWYQCRTFLCVLPSKIINCSFCPTVFHRYRRLTRLHRGPQMLPDRFEMFWQLWCSKLSFTKTLQRDRWNQTRCSKRSPAIGISHRTFESLVNSNSCKLSVWKEPLFWTRSAGRTAL